MAVPAWVEIVFLLSFIVVIVGSFAFIFYFFVAEWSKVLLKRKLTQGLVHDDLTLSDFKNLQLTLVLSDRQVYSALNSMKSDLDFGNSDKRSTLKPKLDNLIKEFNTNKPFSELPEGLVEPLIEVKSKSTEPVAVDNLSEKISIHLKRQKRSDTLLKLATYISLIIGLVSSVIAYLK